MALRNLVMVFLLGVCFADLAQDTTMREAENQTHADQKQVTAFAGNLRGSNSKMMKNPKVSATPGENATAAIQTGASLPLQKSLGISSGAAPCACGKRCAETRRMTANQFACVRWECSKCLKMLVPEEPQVHGENASSLMSLDNSEMEILPPYLVQKSLGISSGAAPCACGKRCAETRRMTANQFACVRWECSKCLKMLVPEEPQVHGENASSLMSLDNSEMEILPPYLVQKSLGISSGAAPCACGKRCAETRRMTANQFACVRWECSKCLKMLVPEELQVHGENASSLMSLDNSEMEILPPYLVQKSLGISSGAAPCACGKRCAETRRMTANQFACVRWECSKCLKMLVPEEPQVHGENASSLMSLDNSEMEILPPYLVQKSLGISSGAAPCACGKRCAETRRMTANQFACVRWECSKCLKMLLPEEPQVHGENASSLMSLDNSEMEILPPYLVQKSLGISSGAAPCACGKRCAETRRMTANQFACVRWECSKCLKMLVPEEPQVHGENASSLMSLDNSEMEILPPYLVQKSLGISSGAAPCACGKRCAETRRMTANQFACVRWECSKCLKMLVPEELQVHGENASSLMSLDNSEMEILPPYLVQKSLGISSGAAPCACGKRCAETRRMTANQFACVRWECSKCLKMLVPEEPQVHGENASSLMSLDNSEMEILPPYLVQKSLGISSGAAPCACGKRCAETRRMTANQFACVRWECSKCLKMLVPEEPQVHGENASSLMSLDNSEMEILPRYLVQKSLGISSGAAPCACGKRCAETRRMTANQFACVRWECSKCLKMLVPEELQVHGENASSLMSLDNSEMEILPPYLVQKSLGISSGAAPCACGKRCAETRRMTANQFACVRWECSKCLKMLVPEEPQVHGENASSLMSLDNSEMEILPPYLVQKSLGISSGAAPCACGKRCAETRRMTANQFACVRWECSKCLKMLLPEEPQVHGENASSLMSLDNSEMEILPPYLVQKSLGISSGAAPCACGKRCAETRRMTANQFACVRWECSKCLKMLVPEEPQVHGENASSLMSLDNSEMEILPPYLVQKSLGISSGAAPCACGKRCAETRRMTANQFACVRWECSKCLKMLVPEELQVHGENASSLMSLDNSEMEILPPYLVQKSLGISSGAAPCACGKRCAETRRMTANQFACVRWECSKCLKMLVPEEPQVHGENASSLMSLDNSEMEILPPYLVQKSLGISSGAAPCACGKRCAETRRMTANQFACVRWECSKCLKMLVPEEPQVHGENASSLMSLDNSEMEILPRYLVQKSLGISSGAAPCACGKRCAETRRMTANQFACVRWECSKCLKMLVPEEPQVHGENASSLSP